MTYEETLRRMREKWTAKGCLKEKEGKMKTGSEREKKSYYQSGGYSLIGLRLIGNDTDGNIIKTIRQRSRKKSKSPAIIVGTNILRLVIDQII